MIPNGLFSSNKGENFDKNGEKRVLLMRLVIWRIK